MGMGLIGAIGGAADAVGLIADQSIKNRYEMDRQAEFEKIVAMREERAASFREKRAALERERVAGIVNSAPNAKTVVDETTGAVSSQPIGHAERMRGATDALIASGDLDAATKTATIGAKRDEAQIVANKERLEIARQKYLDDRAEMREDRRDERQLRQIEAVGERQGQRGGITEPQRVKNKEIDLARKTVADLSPDEIRKRTQKFTNTGRENPDYDAGLATRVRQASQRKYGEDDYFDAQLDGGGEQSPPASNKPPADVDDLGRRFAADPAMKGMRIGGQTANGREVLDASGKLVGHYR